MNHTQLFTSVQGKVPVILPIRSISTGKTRLRQDLGAQTNGIIIWMLSELLKKLQHYDVLQPIILTKDPEDSYLQTLDIPVIQDTSTGLNSSLQALLHDLAKITKKAIILLGDVPSLSPKIIHATIILLNQYQSVSIPTKDQGTALLGIQLPLTFPLVFGESSYMKFQQVFTQYRVLNVQIKQNMGLIDIDDLESLKQVHPDFQL